MKKIITSAFLLASVGATADVFISQPSSTSLSKGGAVNSNDIGSVVGNPANAHFIIPQGSKKKVRMGMLGSINVGAEVGDLDDIDSQLDDLNDALDKNDFTAAEAQVQVDRFNQFLTAAEEDGYVRVSATIEAPIVPIVYQTDIGTFSFDVSGGALVKGNVLSAGDVTLVDNGGGNFGINANAAVFTQSAEVIQVGLGYSRELMASEKGSLSGGIKINLIDMELKSTAVAVEDLESADDALTELDDGISESTTQLGIDIGATWMSPRYTAGFVIKNINEPEFDFPELGGDCSGLAATSLANCNAANTLAASGDIVLKDTFTAEAQATVDGSYLLSSNGRWALNGSLDLNSVPDPMGDEYQWALAGASYSGNGWIPAVRVGYRTNLDGTELSYATLGVTLFSYLSLDVGGSTDSVNYDGDSGPRSFYANLTLRRAL